MQSLRVMAHRFCIVLLFFQFVTGLALAAVANPRSLLEDLGARLQQARSLPVGAETKFRCPDDLNQFKGVSMAIVSAALSKPDFEVGNEHSYFLTSPVPAGQKGGGFPELTFFSNSSGNVERVTCYYSK